MKLPNSVSEIAQVLGTEKALFLVGRLPRYYKKDGKVDGSRVYLYVPTPARLNPDHDLVKWLGWNDAQKLAKYFGGEILQLANCACLYRDYRDMHIARLVQEKVPVKMVAEWFTVSERHVKNLLREIAHEEKPPVTTQTSATNHKKQRQRSETDELATV